MAKRRLAFTLVELLIVIGIIAILIGLSLAWLIGSRRAAGRVVCAANLQQLHHAFDSYAIDFHGVWPVTDITLPAGGSAVPQREWCWMDLVSGYVGSRLNADGTEPSQYMTLKDQHSVFWGCPAHGEPVDGAGYAMNPYPLGARVGGLAPTTPDGPAIARWYAPAPDVSHGRFFKATEWRQPSQRCLLYDSVSLDTAVSWPWWVGTGPMPAHAVAGAFTPDFNRHPDKARRVSADEPAINVLYCDGHVELISAHGMIDTMAVP